MLRETYSLVLSMFLLLIFLTIAACVYGECDSSTLFRDLALVEEIDKKNKDELPFFYNSSMMGGYFNMPSARTAREGVVGFGAARVHPYNIYGVNFQYFDRLELALNYRVYTGMTDPVFGHHGFGDEAERIGNAKLVFNLPGDGLPGFPTFAIGIEDFIGTKRFNSEYIVMTKDWTDYNIEATLGWGRKRIKGFFGGLAWTPWRQTSLTFLKNLSLLAEYDATDYKHHVHEHPKGRKVSSRINAGINYVWRDTLQLSMSSLRGREFSAMGSIRYPLGSSNGFIPKTREPILYRSPVDTEPLGVVRPERDFVNELGFTLGQQGLDLYQVYSSNSVLWLKIVNNMYREEHIVRERLQRILAAITPSNIQKVIVVVEADGVVSQGYTFRTEDLYRYRQNQVTAFELETLSPMTNPLPRPNDSMQLFHRRRLVWLFSLYPRLQSFFGSSTGKYKYNLSLVANPEGYIFDSIYYDTQISYAVSSSIQKLKSRDRLNPSQLPNVRSDSIKYFQTNTASFETAYLQKSWNIKNTGCFFRLAGGYFEPAYGGEATELLYYPASSNWAIGAEQATVWKRRYHGLGFTHKIRRFRGHRVTHEPFLGVQYFANVYYTLKPWNLDFKIKAGQFLAKDRGVRFEVSRWFPSGLQVSLWYTITNGHDHVNHRTYFDKGFAFSLPLDFFLRQSSRTYLGYAMSAWLRDVGASAETGKGLYPTVRLERLQLEHR